MKWDPNIRSVSAASEGRKLVFVAWNAPVLGLFSSEETYRFNCSGCGSVLGIRMWPDKGRRLAFKCPTCRHLTNAEDLLDEVRPTDIPAA